MTFHVPEPARIVLGAMRSDASYGNNGAFKLESTEQGWSLFIVASDGEAWQPIHGYEGLYEVSTLGGVRALPKTITVPNGGQRHHAAHTVALEIMEKGYRRVSLCRDGRIEKRLVHVLVAEAFITNQHGYPEINHRDGRKDNNCVINLEWCTREYNRHHAIERGLAPGMTLAEIEQISTWLANGVTTSDIADRIGRSRQRVGDIKAGRVRSGYLPAPTGYPGINTFWEHVSVHAERGAQPPRRQRTPNWAEMCFVKDQFWDDDDVVIQYHPRRADYVNQHAHTLHLWRPIGVELPTPDAGLVGVRG